MSLPYDGLVWGEALRLVGVTLAAALFVTMARDDRSHSVRSLVVSASALFTSSVLLLCAWSFAGEVPRWTLTTFVALAAAGAALRASYAVGGIRVAAVDHRQAATIGGGVALALIAALMPEWSPASIAFAAMSIVEAMALGVVALAAARILSSWTPARAAMSATAFVAAGTALVPIAGVVIPDIDARFWIAAGACRGVLEAGLALTIAFHRSELDRRRALAAVAQAEELAYHDLLTGLPNRALFFDRLNVALAHAARHKHKLAVLFLDLDRFKNVNDSLGHSAGDEMIREAALRLNRCMRHEDTVARFGGDEFILLLRIVGRVEDAGRVAQKVLETVAQPYTIGGREIITTASVGIALYPVDGIDAETLVRNADSAMYRAKEAGRDVCRFYAPAMNANALEELELESDLRRALDRKQLALHYQPLIDVVKGKIYGLEALLRWEHPKLGLLTPDRFIPLAESTGLIVPIGNWVIREACRQIKEWHRMLGLDLVVAVNLSPRQFEQADLPGQVRAAFEAAGLRPRYLELEITESHAMADVAKSIRILRELKVLGVRLAIDDFGTGYSSLSYLKQFPVDTLKLDRSFVREITVPEDGAIARGIIAMAHSLSLRVLAEGVETLGQLEFLKQNACDRLQGYLFSRPLPAPAFEKFAVHRGNEMRVA
ncbi:MAG: EAL domain-containing protein [Acidobacteria bacterium]|nr:EAL domain-containing protein [Acidobacteriota bacterium]